MVIIALLISMVLCVIHYYNGGTFEDLVKVGSLVVLLWMLDILVHLHIIARPIKEMNKASWKKSEKKD